MAAAQTPGADVRGEVAVGTGPNLSTCARCGGTIQRTTLGWQHVTVPAVQHAADPDDSWVAEDEPEDGVCTECGRDVSRPGMCFDCDVEASYVGGLAPRFGAQP